MRWWRFGLLPLVGGVAYVATLLAVVARVTGKVNSRTVAGPLVLLALYGLVWLGVPRALRFVTASRGGCWALSCGCAVTLVVSFWVMEALHRRLCALETLFAVVSTGTLGLVACVGWNLLRSDVGRPHLAVPTRGRPS